MSHPLSNLQNLSWNQISQALLWLTNGEPQPPEDLRHLSPLDWELLQHLLENLMLERQYNQLH